MVVCSRSLIQTDVGVALGGLERGAATLRSLDDTDILGAWSRTVETFLDPSSEVRKRLAPELVRSCRLSPEGLTAALDSVLRGVAAGPATALARSARELPLGGPPVGLILASNIPGLVVQQLLPGLLRRRPLLIKSSSREPHFAPAFVGTLCRVEPRLREALAVLVWEGGDPRFEVPLADAVGRGAVARVIAYGGGPAMDDLRRRLGERLVAFGPKLSLAVVGGDVDPTAVAEGLARDVALFDQRGCLSVQAVYVEGDGRPLAEALASALDRRATAWPPGEPLDDELGAVRQVRDEAVMAGGWVAPLEIHRGTVILDPRDALRPSPGLRTVRVHGVDDLRRLPFLGSPVEGALQGVALAGRSAEALVPDLEALGVSRMTAPGSLQTPDASWANGGLSPLEVFDI